MQIEDARKFVAVLMVTYPNYNPIDEELASETWKSVTEEYTYEQVNMALKSYMRSNASGFAPAPGQIIDKIHAITAPRELDETEAWSLVSQAIRNSGYNSVSEFAKLPPAVQKAVGIPDQLRIWALDEHYNESVASSNFIKSYRPIIARKKEFEKMPQNVRNCIEKINDSSYSGYIEQKRRQVIENANERKQDEIKALEMKYEGVFPPDRTIENMRKRLEVNQE